MRWEGASRFGNENVKTNDEEGYDVFIRENRLLEDLAAMKTS